MLPNDLINELAMINNSINWWRQEMRIVTDKIQELEAESFSLEKEQLLEDYNDKLSYLVSKGRIEVELLRKVKLKLNNV
jgi:DNA repair exonuclease SbcCD ATPase subunit